MATKRTGYVPGAKPSMPEVDPGEPDTVAGELEEFHGEEPAEVKESAGSLPVGLAVMIVIVLDVSGSMAAYARQVIAGLGAMIASLLREKATSLNVDLLVVPFAGTARAYGFEPAARFTVPNLEFGGMTHLGDALDFTREKIEERFRQYATNGVQLIKCMEFVITDGQPSGAYREAFGRNKLFESRNRRVEVFPVAAGDAALPVLQELSGVREPLRLDTAKWDRLFAFIYESAKLVSGSVPGEEVELPEVTWAKTRRG